MKNLGIIGLGRLGEFYLRDLVNLKINPIILKNSTYKTSLKRVQELNKKYNLKVKAARTFKRFFKDKFDTVLICSLSIFHYNHIKKTLDNNRDVIIEKPIISLNRKVSKKTNLKKLNDLFNYNNKIYYNLINEYYAKKYLKLFKNKKFSLKKFDFFYHTTGHHVYDQIIDDLVPHLFSILDNLIKYKSIHSIKKKINKNNCKIKFYVDNCFCSIELKQNCKKKLLKFGLDGYLVERKMIEKKNKVLTYLSSNKLNKKIDIKNPLTESVKEILKKSRVYNKKLEKQKIIKNFKNCCEIFYA